jgi:hypothetical protein
MKDLKLTVTIYKIGFLGDHLSRRTTKHIAGYIPANKIIKNENTYIECKNSKVSKYYAIASATAFVDGKSLKTLPVLSEKTLPFPCGY